MEGSRVQRSLKGVTLLESLVAGLILAVALVGLFSLWNVCAIRIQTSAETNQAGELARAELERAKVFGAVNFPFGVYNPVSGTATWTGCSSAAGWTPGGVAYFDIAGNRLGSSSGARFGVQLAVLDTSILPGSGGVYAITGGSRRAVICTVTRLPDNNVVLSSGTNLVVGGL